MINQTINQTIMGSTIIRRIETNDETLERVDVVSEMQLRQFITAVPENSNILDLFITGGVIIGPDIATSLSAILPRMPSISGFSMYHCDCSNADGLSILASALSNKASLTDLCLNRCHIGHEGAEIIASSFGNNTTLTMLDLRENVISDEGAIAVASLFLNNSSIRDVNLISNNIGADGISALAASVRENRSVRSIQLDHNAHNHITHFKRALYDDGSIEGVLSSNHTLVQIDPQTSELQSLLQLNRDGPEHALRSKTIRFLNEQPTYVLTMGLEGNAMPLYIEKIGRDCKFNTIFELIRNVPGLSEGHGRHPEQPSRKGSRS